MLGGTVVSSASKGCDAHAAGAEACATPVVPALAFHRCYVIEVDECPCANHQNV
jgi:hypothetical protein